MGIVWQVFLIVAITLAGLPGVAIPADGHVRTTAGVTYIHSDHPSASLRAGLGSTAVTSGAQSGDIKYFPYGATRSGSVGTAYKFTGQRLDDSTGLYYYGARYYDPALGRFVQADTIVPNPGNPQALNRYAYVLNNPVRYRDPSGHWAETVWDIANIAWDIYEVKKDPSLLNIGALVVDVAAAVIPFVPGGVGAIVRGGKAAKAAVEVASHADEAMNAAKAASRLAEVGLHSDKAADLVKTLAKASTRGPANPKGITVLGHYSLYIDKAKELGATYLDMNPAVWKALSGDAELAWAVNKQFLDDAIARGDKFILAIPETGVNPGSFLARELEYLRGLGWEIVDNVLVKVK